MPDEAPLEWIEAQDEEDGFHLSNLFPRDTGLPMTVWVGDPFLMANLYPKSTGLPMPVWVSERGGARHDGRLKVNMNPGARAVRGDEIAVVAVRPQPRLMHGDLGRADLELVSRWITLNQDVIVDYWTGAADTADLVERLQRLPG